MSEFIKNVLNAPESVLRWEGSIRQLDEATWTMPQGECVAAFMSALGPPAIVRYSFLTQRHRLNEVFVEHIPEREVSTLRKTAAHDRADRFRLTEFGQKTSNKEYAWSKRKGTIGQQTVLYCAGKGYGVEVDGTNCQRLCGKLGPGPCGCAQQKATGHSCSVRVKLTSTLAEISKGEVTVTLSGTHVPPGTVANPPALSALRPDPATVRAMVMGQLQEPSRSRHYSRGSSGRSGVRGLEVPGIGEVGSPGGADGGLGVMDDGLMPAGLGVKPAVLSASGTSHVTAGSQHVSNSRFHPSKVIAARVVKHIRRSKRAEEAHGLVENGVPNKLASELEPTIEGLVGEQHCGGFIDKQEEWERSQRARHNHVIQDDGILLGGHVGTGVMEGNDSTNEGSAFGLARDVAIIDARP